jgi:hypothetical protein
MPRYVLLALCLVISATGPLNLGGMLPGMSQAVTYSLIVE